MSNPFTQLTTQLTTQVSGRLSELSSSGQYGDPIETTGTLSDRTAISFYFVYAIIALGLVIWLARTLFSNGKVFLADVFENEDMAKAVNHLLVVGFYLLNLGYALTLYKVQTNLSLTGAYNGLISRIGMLLLSLGVIHLVNMFVFWRIRNHRSRAQQSPRPAPQFTAPVPAFVAQPAPPANPGSHYAR